MEDEWIDDPLWGGAAGTRRRAERCSGGQSARNRPPRAAAAVAGNAGRHRAAPAAPLAPSSLGEELSPDPPRCRPVRARRPRGEGCRCTSCWNACPMLPRPSARRRRRLWLARSAADLAAPARSEMTEAALAVLGHKAWADLFSPAALAEDADRRDGRRAGDRRDDRPPAGARIRLVDFKTARRPPPGWTVPVAILRQMAAYAAALEAAYQRWRPRCFIRRCRCCWKFRPTCWPSTSRH